MFEARVYNIMIGAPSDIKDEIIIARNALYKWNCLNSMSDSIVLNVLYWESSTYPCLMQAQKSINEQIVDKSDLLICVFGTKLGTPINGFPSGTAEEIERHRLRGKNVMIFFRGENDTKNVDIDSFSALLKFKKDISDEIYYGEYNNANDFENILLNKLQLFINNNWKLNKESINIYVNSKEHNAIHDSSSFFNLFQQGGLVYQCVECLMVKYDLAHIKGFYQELTESDKIYFYQTLPNRILENKEALNIDLGNLFKEIDVNIKQYTTINDKEDYAIGLLRPFANYLKIVKPSLLPQKRIEEIEQGFAKILKDTNQQNSIEIVYRDITLLLERYTDWLEYTLAHNGISLFLLQNKVGIYLTNRTRHIAHRYTQWTTDVDAKRIADELNTKYNL